MSISQLLNFTVEFGANSGYPVINIISNGQSYNLFSSVNWDTVHFCRDLGGVGILIVVISKIFVKFPNILDGNLNVTNDK